MKNNLNKFGVGFIIGVLFFGIIALMFKAYLQY